MTTNNLKEAYKLNERNCEICKTPFTPFRPFQVVCSWGCSIELGKLKVAAKVQKQKDKVWRVEKAVRKEKIMTVSDYEKLLETEINAIVRLVDAGLNCISCPPDTPIKKIFAGHFRSVKSNPSIRFNLHNEARQCFSCNGKGGGKPIQYLEGLERDYGKEYADYVHYELTRIYKYMNWKIDDLKGWIVIAREIKKELIKLDLTYSPKERINLRNEFNKKIGIYL